MGILTNHVRHCNQYSDMVRKDNISDGIEGDDVSDDSDNKDTGEVQETFMLNNAVKALFA